jgi:membrane protein DedA with SNARE-associated domain
MNDQILAFVSQFGAPALFVIVAIAAVGIPFPVTLLLLITGSMISQGALHLWTVICAAGAGSILGDQAGYAIGRWGGHAAIARLTPWLSKSRQLEAVEAKMRHWGGPGIFITRWLLSPLGPWINFACGTANFPWRWFLFWDVLGEFTGAALYISLGRYFSDRVMALDGVLGNVTGTAAALLAALLLGFQLVRYARRPRKGR